VVKIPKLSKETWEDAGYDDDQRFHLERSGVTLDTAEQWRSERFDVFDTVSWLEAKFTLEEAKEWRASGFGRDIGPISKARYARKLLDAGLSIEEACQWTEAVDGNGLTKNMTRTDATALVLGWREAGFSADDTKSLLSARFDLKDAVILRRNKMSVEEACEWGKHSLGSPHAAEIIRWKRGEFLPEEAGQWVRVSVSRTPEEAAALKNAGLTPEEAGRYASTDYRSVDEIISKHRENPWPTLKDRSSRPYPDRSGHDFPEESKHASH
jgi:hypothetical protein